MLDFDAYDPIAIAAASGREARAYPPEHLVPGVPWIANSKAYCQSTSLQMIAEWRTGEVRPVGFYNWRMGFTYGAGHLRRSWVFLPFADPEAGLRYASPGLGLRHRYFVSDDAEAYRVAALAAIADDVPLRIMVDSATLKGRTDYFSPHSIVVAGYAGDKAAVFEPRAGDRRELGSRGELVPWQLILQAARKVAAIYRYPWTYQFTRFDPAPPAAHDERAVCTRNAAALAGADDAFAPTGAHALRSLASELGRAGQSAAFGLSDLRVFLEYGVYTRADDAAYLNEAFPDQSPLAAAASDLAAASDCYSVAVSALAGDVPAVDRIVSQLEHAAALEAQASLALTQAAQGS